MNIFLVPGTADNESTSLRKAVPFDHIARFLENSDLNVLRDALRGERPIHCWAMKEGSRSHFDRMEVGDEVLFFISGTGLCKYHGRAISKAESGTLGRHLWSRDSLDWKLIYFVDDLTPVRVEKRFLLTALGYDNPNDVLAGIRPVHDDCVREIFGTYGSVNAFLDAVKSERGDLRLKCAKAPSGVRKPVRPKPPKPRTVDDPREALRSAVRSLGCPMPPAKVVPQLIERVLRTSDKDGFSMEEGAEKVLLDYFAKG